jgi:deoxyhypusine synthase
VSKKVEHLKIRPKMRVSELIDSMGKSGVFSAGRLAEAVGTYQEMIENDATIFMGVGGALVPGGLRQLFVKMISEGLVDVIVTTGANVTHDLIESFGGSHLRGEPMVDDAKLRRQGISRIYDAYVPQKAFELFEDMIQPMFEDVTKVDKRMSSAKLLHEIGLRIKDRGSILRTAATHKVPVFTPAIADSILGLQAWLYSQEHELIIDGLLDVREMVELADKAEKPGAVILGGGVPKNFVLQSMLLTSHAFEYAIQITMDRPEPGGLSGATLDEAKSWGKVSPSAKLVTIIGDATVVFPLLITGLLARLRR